MRAGSMHGKKIFSIWILLASNTPKSINTQILTTVTGPLFSESLTVFLTLGLAMAGRKKYSEKSTGEAFQSGGISPLVRYWGY